MNVEGVRTSLEVAWIRLRYSLGWVIAVAAISLLFVGAYGMVEMGMFEMEHVLPPLETQIGGVVGQRLGLLADHWSKTIPCAAAAAWFALKL